MITAIFYTHTEKPHGTGTIQVETRHEIATGKCTIPEAYDVAVSHGADPRGMIRYQFNEKKERRFVMPNGIARPRTTAYCNGKE